MATAKTATAKSGAAKAGAAKTAAKRAPKPASAKAKPGAAPDADAAFEDAAAGTATTATLRKKELLERVVALTGAKKKDAKEVVEATLRVLGEALTSGEELILPPFGKAKVNRQRDLTSGEVMIVKLRRTGASGTDGAAAAGGPVTGAAESDDNPLAEAEEER